MSTEVNVKPEFVEYIPEMADMEENVLYISKQWTTASHLCLCGCKKLVVTPLGGSGKSWQMLIEDDKFVTLSPSIGNNYFECKSHYHIIRNKGIID